MHVIVYIVCITLTAIIISHNHRDDEALIKTKQPAVSGNHIHCCLLFAVLMHPHDNVLAQCGGLDHSANPLLSPSTLQ